MCLFVVLLMSARNTRAGLKGEGNYDSVKATLDKSSIKSGHAGLDHPLVDGSTKQDAVSETDSTHSAVSIHDNFDRRANGDRPLL